MPVPIIGVIPHTPQETTGWSEGIAQLLEAWPQLVLFLTACTRAVALNLPHAATLNCKIIFIAASS